MALYSLCPVLLQLLDEWESIVSCGEMLKYVVMALLE